MTLMHDRFLEQGLNSKRSKQEAVHWYQATSLFSKVLSQPLDPAARDAIWATAALVGAITFFDSDAATPEEAFPLNTPSATELDWLRMSDGKKEIWRLSDPTREDSPFRGMAIEMQKDFIRTYDIGSEIDPLPYEFVDLYSLDATSTPEGNPYHIAASVLGQLMEYNCNQSTVVRFLSFISHVHPDFKQLLEFREPRALLLLAYWLGKLCQYEQWWIWRRALLQCQSTVLYLERYHGDDKTIMKLVHYPRTLCGLA